MTRARPVDYAGPTARLPLDRAGRLGARWVVQPKVDGCYATVHLDRAGRVERIRSRAAVEFKVPELLGAFLGWPDSVLVAELEYGTEWSTRTVATRGHRVLHVHDVLRAGGRYVGREPYHVRRDLAWRMQSEVVNLAPEVPWTRDDQGSAHDRLTGRFVSGTPTDFRLAPIVPQLPASRIDHAWSQWGPDAGGEGLVAVNLDAPVGAGGAKKKVKREDDIDCVVVSVGRNAARLVYGGHAFVVSAAGRQRPCSGEIWTVRCAGWYEGSATPRFPRLVRRREDLMGFRRSA